MVHPCASRARVHVLIKWSFLFASWFLHPSHAGTLARNGASVMTLLGLLPCNGILQIVSKLWTVYLSVTASGDNASHHIINLSLRARCATIGQNNIFRHLFKLLFVFSLVVSVLLDIYTESIWRLFATTIGFWLHETFYGCVIWL